MSIHKKLKEQSMMEKGLIIPAATMQPKKGHTRIRDLPLDMGKSSSLESRSPLQSTASSSFVSDVWKFKEIIHWQWKTEIDLGI
jgi:hypothetical protein